MRLSAFDELDDSTLDAIRDAAVGQDVSIRGKRYRVEKKTLTAVNVRRMFWWDGLWQRLTS